MNTIKGKNLTSFQKQFLVVLQKLVSDSGKPVSAGQLKTRIFKSDSRVRAYLKILIEKGYVRCVGKVKVKKYVPSNLGLRQIMGKGVMSGYCEGTGCCRLAEDFFHGQYLCRTCMVGSDSDDRADLKRQLYEISTIKSSAGLLSETKAKN